MKARNEKFIVVYTTVEKKKDALRIARNLLKDRLVACVNIFPIFSKYWWKGKIEDTDEYGMILKTRKALYERIERKIRKLHPYSLPAIETWEIGGSRKFLDWIALETEIRLQSKRKNEYKRKY